MKVIIQLQYSLTDSRVFHDVKNIMQSILHPTQPNPTQPMDGPNPWPTLVQISMRSDFITRRRCWNLGWIFWQRHTSFDWSRRLRSRSWLRLELVRTAAPAQHTTRHHRPTTKTLSGAAKECSE